MNLVSQKLWTKSKSRTFSNLGPELKQNQKDFKITVKTETKTKY